MTNLFKEIGSLKGVGEKRRQLYEKLGISTPYDLLYYFPRTHTDFTEPISILDAPLNESSVIRGRIVRKLQEKVIRKGMTVYKAVARDFNVDYVITIFNNFYAFEALEVDAEYCFYGKITGDILHREILSPHIVRSDSEVLLEPIYPLTAGLTGAMLRTNIKESLEIMESEPFETLPEELLEKHGLASLSVSLHDIHRPASKDALEQAKRRLAFDELLLLQLGMQMLKNKNRNETGCKMDGETDISEFYNNIPFELTAAQFGAINEICADLCSEFPMNRLLQGDVGSGKTAVAAAACYFAHKSGFQSALMAPTEILASQHYRTLSTFLEPMGVNVCLLTGSLTAKEKNEIKTQISNGACSVIVGTHAIIQKSTEYKRLGLVITDEQHRFGVSQRAALASKGEFPHKLVMSATPIPRTLALIIYGDLDVSVLNELPKGRTPIETYAVTGKLRQRAYKFIRERISEGHQAYIVCPMIDDNDNDLNAVCSYAEKLKKGIFSDCKVGLLHGRLSAAEKDDVMGAFHSGYINLLVCTTVVEVGVDVPNAVVMLVENSERFGLSQLHQLRGRVGRGTEKSYCILVTDNVTDESRERLKIMSSIADGFRISEEDLKLRGPGDFFGNRQHGLPPLKIADIAGNMELMALTRDVAKQITDEDAQLSSPKYRALRVEVTRLYAKSGENSLN